MKSYLLLLPVFILALLEGTITTLPLTFVLVLAWAAGEENFFLAFASGLILDFLKGNRLGTSSLIFLSVSFLVFLYRRKFKATNFAYFLPFTFFACLFYLYFNIGFWRLPEAFISTVLAMPTAIFVFWFLENIKPEGKLKLKV